MNLHKSARSFFNSYCKLYAVLAITFLLFSACRQQPAENQQNAREIIVAAAANLTDAFAEVAKQFTAKTGIRVVYSFGSTADLTKQIENGAPFDLFAAADVKHVDELNGKGLIVPDTEAVFARGRLVLWMPPQGRIEIKRIEDVARAEVKNVAIANPEVAPYGQASVEALRALNVWSQVEPKVVYGTNVANTKQFASSGNADVAFIPLALVKRGEGQYLDVDERLHQPIDQALAVIKSSGKQDLARSFVDFVLSDDGQAILQEFGYSKPPAE